jgi:large subunit ribosomal protein L9
MDVILMERIEKLGQMGDVVSVKPGYARNYLLPQKKAMRATEANRVAFDTQRVQLEAANLERRTEAEGVAKKVDGLFVVLVRQAGEAGQLYGSVNGRDVADQVTEAGVTIERRQIQLDRPIKSIGLHTVRVDLHPEVSVSITVNVARSEDEAEIQEKTGRAVVYRDDEDEPAPAAPATVAAPETEEEPAPEGETEGETEGEAEVEDAEAEAKPVDE